MLYIFKVAHKVSTIKQRFEVISKRSETLRLKEGDGKSQIGAMCRLPSSRYADLSWDDKQRKRRKCELNCTFESDLTKVEVSIIAQENKKMHETWRSICGTFKTKQEIGMWRDYLRLRFLQDVPALEQSTTIGAADVQKLHEMWESMSADLSWDNEQINSQKHGLKCIFESDLKVVEESIIAPEKKKLLETWKSICGDIKTKQEMGIWQEYLNDWFLEEVPTFGQDIRAHAQKLQDMWDNMIIDLNWNDKDIESHKLAQRLEFREQFRKRARRHSLSTSIHSHVKESIIEVDDENIQTHQFRGPSLESNMEAKIEELRNTWNNICATLKDAEKMEIWKESVKFWLQELRNLAFEAEDILGIYDYNQHQARVEGNYDHMEAQQVNIMPT